jgi:hypothetical protein
MPSKLPLLTTCALLGIPAAALAEPNPQAVSIRVTCQQQDSHPKSDDAGRACKKLSGWFEGRLDFRSGGQVGDEASGKLLFSEFGRFYALPGDNNEVLIYADGGGIRQDFEQRYLTPGPENVLTAPDLRVVLYVEHKGEFTKLTDQKFAPVASAAWARYAEEALRFKGELKGDVVGTQHNTRVVALQNVPLSNTAPSRGQELRFNGSQWVPTTPSPLTAGAGLQGGSYDGQSPATFSVVFGAGPGTVTEGSDVRLPPVPGAAGQLLYSNGSKWSALPPSTGAQVLHGGETPTWGPVSLNGEVTGVLPVGNGGTGLASPGWEGNVLRSTGYGWESAPLRAGDVPAGSNHYIQNQGASKQGAQLWISGTARVGGLQVGAGSHLQGLQLGSLTLSPPGRCDGFPIVRCTYTYWLPFPTAFSSPPTVIVTPRATCGDCADTFNVITRNVGTEGFEIVVTRTDPYSLGGDWGQELQLDFVAGN